MKTIRRALLAVAFSATVAGALTGASLPGETREASPATTCAEAAWPVIPAACLNNDPSDKIRYLRYVTTDNPVAANPIDIRAMQERFAVAFQ